MSRFTVLVMTDQTSPVKRFQVSKMTLKRAAVGAALVLLMLAIGSIDYVRKWRDNSELHVLRVETLSQREQIHQLESTLTEVDERLERLRQLERKLRVITNLPGLEENTGMGGGVDESNGVEEEPGFDLSEESEPSNAQALAEANSEAQGYNQVAVDEQSEAGQAVKSSEENATDTRGPLMVARLSRLRIESERLRAQAAEQEVGLAQLVDHLHGQSRRLAATPSIWPTKGWLTSRFGPRVSPFTNHRQFHAGIDISTAMGTAVVAPASGKVVFAGRKRLLGNTVVIDHGNGLRTTYGHNSKLHVRKGEHVERGDLISSVGSTGLSTGPHLHYSVALNGRAVNPLDYILD